ncbi:MAG: methyltransferase domain-containing protein [Gammaproteobacteria bacterium]|nr:MAG: methyltransferase domain-containing protein [Gammaproteobacteria bacterium]
MPGQQNTLTQAIRRDSRLYRVLRWAYQPIKAVKHELKGLRDTRTKRRLVPEYLAQPGFHGLHVGCGPNRMPGWINTDFESGHPVDFDLDITKPLPFPDACLDAIYAEEVIEHVELDEGRIFLAEARRILKPGGVMRLTTPGADECCRIYLGMEERKADEWGQFWLNQQEFSPEMWLNSCFNFYGHKHIYSGAQLQRELIRAGFGETRFCKPHVSESGIVELSGLERRYGDAPDWIFLSTVIVEAR